MNVLKAKTRLNGPRNDFIIYPGDGMKTGL